MFVDTHCHLSFEAFDIDRDQVVREMDEHGVAWIVNPGVSVDESRKAVACSEQYHSVYAGVGFHPCKLPSENDLASTIDELEQLASGKKVVAIGEIGMDFHYEHNPSKHVQEVYFREQLRLAKRQDVPVIVHVRDAWNETFKIIEEEQSDSLRGIFHCFSGGKAEAERAISLGFMVSFSGMITFNNRELREVVSMLPDETILTETDAPYLSPHPHRGKRNVPSSVPLVTQEVATIKNQSLEETKEIIFQNAKRIFNINH